MKTFGEFLQWEGTTRDTIDFKKIYVDIAGGDIAAGLILSELLYWYLPASDGGSRMRVQKEGALWIAVARSGWWDRTRLRPKAANRAINLLIELGIVVKEVFKFNGDPTTHLRIEEHRFLELWQHYTDNPPQNPALVAYRYARNGHNETAKEGITKRSKREVPVTENTSESTSETTKEKEKTLHVPKSPEKEDAFSAPDGAGGVSVDPLKEVKASAPVNENSFDDEGPEDIENHPDYVPPHEVVVNGVLRRTMGYIRPKKPTYKEVVETHWSDKPGMVGAIISQLAGSAKTGKRADFKFDPPASAEEVHGFGLWWEEEHEGIHIPVAADVLKEHFDQFRAVFEYAEYVERAKLWTEARGGVPLEPLAGFVKAEGSAAPYIPPGPEQAKAIDERIKQLAAEKGKFNERYET